MWDFIQELRERNVFCVAAVYGVVAWVVIQLSTVLENKFFLAESTDAYVAAAFYLGFPAVLIAAWFIEMTPDGLQVRGKSDPDNINQAADKPPTDYVMAGAFALLACFVTADIVIPDRAVPLSAEAIEQVHPSVYAEEVIVELPPLAVGGQAPAAQDVVADLVAPVEAEPKKKPDITADLPTGSVSVPSTLE